PFASASSTAWRTSLVRNPFVSPELCPSDAIASSRSIYATTPKKVAQPRALHTMSPYLYGSELRHVCPFPLLPEAGPTGQADW
ncbi:MAG: hypothetical protein VB140_09725, partial [Burkholderia sp.]